MAVTNLSQYYSSKGQSLPSVSARAPIYASYGLGGTYTGTAAQNTALLGKLLSGSPAPASAPAPSGGSAQQNYDNFVASERARIDQQLASQKAEQEGLFGQFENLQRNQEALPALYQRLETEAGIPELSQQAAAFKDQIFRVKSLLDRVGEDITARTSGTLTTEAQRRRLEASESETLNTELGRLGTGLAPVADLLSSAQGRLGTMMSLNAQEQEQELEPVKMRINALSDRFARELSGYSEQRELTLTSLLDKLERERFLSDRDWQLAQQLAAEERNFSRQKQLAKIQLGSQIKSGGNSRGSASSTRRLPGIQTPIRLQTDQGGVMDVIFGQQPSVNLQQAFASGGLQ